VCILGLSAKKLLRLDFDFDHYFKFHLNLPFYKYNNGTTVLFHYIIFWQIFEISNIQWISSILFESPTFDSKWCNFNVQ